MSKNSSKIIYLIFHSLGLSCLAGAVFLQALVFIDILQHGYFMAVENNQAILIFETVLTAFAVFYFVCIYLHFIRTQFEKLGVGV